MGVDPDKLEPGQYETDLRDDYIDLWILIALTFDLCENCDINLHLEEYDIQLLVDIAA